MALSDTEDNSGVYSCLPACCCTRPDICLLDKAATLGSSKLNTSYEGGVASGGATNCEGSVVSGSGMGNSPAQTNLAEKVAGTAESPGEFAPGPKTHSSSPEPSSDTLVATTPSPMTTLGAIDSLAAAAEAPTATTKASVAMVVSPQTLASSLPAGVCGIVLNSSPGSDAPPNSLMDDDMPHVHRVVAGCSPTLLVKISKSLTSF